MACFVDGIQAVAFQKVNIVGWQALSLDLFNRRPPGSLPNG